jgi:hypothetical protein
LISFVLIGFFERIKKAYRKYQFDISENICINSRPVIEFPIKVIPVES